MSKTSSKSKATQQSVKVQDFIKTLQILEKLYQNPLGKNPHIISFIKELRVTLNPYKKLKENEFFDLLKASLSTYEKRKIKIERKGTVEYVNVENITFEELRTLLSSKSLSKEQLLLIGEKRLGISKGAHRRLKKEELQNLIESAMENVETLHIIKKKASE
ncbi:MAG: hypothetical protein DRP61_05040 [Candidatus Omnitrophota bacterium]|nr:MAG: hypothetical protein DRP61_05040 [Candidatus Omnitrophota bacterium]